MPINAEWHRAHPMPKNPSRDERARWHQEHADACGCRPIPESVLRAIARQEKRNGPKGTPRRTGR